MGCLSAEKFYGDTYRIAVRLDNRRIDSKTRDYAMHGSIGADRAKKYSGKMLRITGDITKRGKLVLKFEMQCKVL